MSDYVSIASPSLTDYSESPLALPPVLDTIHPPPPVNDFLLYIGTFSSLFIINKKRDDSIRVLYLSWDVSLAGGARFFLLCCFQLFVVKEHNEAFKTLLGVDSTLFFLSVDHPFVFLDPK